MFHFLPKCFVILFVSVLCFSHFSCIEVLADEKSPTEPHRNTSSEMIPEKKTEIPPKGDGGAVTHTVSKAGGTACYGKLFCVDIPKGNIEKKELKVTIKKVQHPPKGAISDVFDVGPDVWKPKTSINIRFVLPFSQIGWVLDKTALQIAFYRNGVWNIRDTRAVDVSSPSGEKTVKFSATGRQFSMWAVVYGPWNIDKSNKCKKKSDCGSHYECQLGICVHCDAPEHCGNLQDDDCDGMIDEGC